MKEPFFLSVSLKHWPWEKIEHHVQHCITLLPHVESFSTILLGVTMAAYGLLIENGCYGVKKGSQFQALSNCTFRLLSPILAGTMSGYLAKATHKDGTEK